jgi:DNA gyrase/topoisomerase IV subunit A
VQWYAEEAALITPEKIAEWLKEVEERPTSGSIIIQYIANRLSELTARNEELLAENIELRSGRKVEEYESRITNLEYQLDLLKRQVGGQVEGSAANLAANPEAVETTSLLVYNPQGQVLRLEINPAELESGEAAADFPRMEFPEKIPTRLLATGSRQELLFVFDSGRTQTLPVSEIPAADPQKLSWRQAYLQEPRGAEELAFLLPIGRMALFETAVQASRRGFTKKIKRALLENYILKDYIGSGTKLPSDRTCGLALCRKDDLFVMTSQQGFVFSIPVERLPFAVEEALRLGPADHIAASFAISSAGLADSKESSFLVVTQNGKAIQRDVSWLEPADSFKSHGQPIFSKERRAAGVHVVGAAAVGEGDWGLALRSDGKLTAHKMADLFGSGSFLVKQPPADILGFAPLYINNSSYHPAVKGRKNG